MSTLSPVDLALLLHSSSDQAEHTLTSFLLSLPPSLIDPTQSTTSTSSSVPPKLPHRTQLLLSHRSSNLLDVIVRNSASLVKSYKDEGGEFKEEIDVVGGRGEPGGDLMEFYERLGKLKESHRKYPGAGSAFASVLFNPDSVVNTESMGMLGVNEEDEMEKLEKMFSGEELLGRYLDLNADFERFINLPNFVGKRPSYLSYLSSFDDFSAISKPTKSSPQYLKYLQQLFQTLQSFARRSFPLSDMEKVAEIGEKEFDSRWENGQVEGWEEMKEGQNGNQGEGVWCVACQKMFAKQTVYDNHLKGAKHMKAENLLKEGSKAPHGTNGNGNATPSEIQTLETLRRTKSRPVALLEYQIKHILRDPLCPLGQIRNDTKANVERRAALTDKERQAEIEELEAKEAAALAEAAEQAKGGSGVAVVPQPEEEEDDEERIYNPLKLPLGWDGKPIPYWLYKLHGLGVEYKCEICSDHIYMGRKNFERHFQESRHAFGMRALGLPNTKHFHEITRIEDAYALAEKLKQEGRQQMFQQETMEELEDDEGNVYNRKTYEDMRRQGLL